ncbi:hypothetical protein [Novosphingobium lentum]|uniref:hypothetical protein n=1 Tax=Novosphingobium lentum TaxID=145287 RepID=UPI00082E5319|nr:hypothetical protein [Novosphingobium lentum]
MIDNITILLPHALLAIAIWRMLKRDDLDHDPALPRERIVPHSVRRKAATPAGVGPSAIEPAGIAAAGASSPDA